MSCIRNRRELSLKPFQSFVFHDLHHEMVLCVAFSHDGEEVVAGGMSGHVKVGLLEGFAIDRGAA